MNIQSYLELYNSAKLEVNGQLFVDAAISNEYIEAYDNSSIVNREYINFTSVSSITYLELYSNA